MTWYQFKYEIKKPVADDGDQRPVVDVQGSAQISDDQEHEDAGEQHAPDHDELILSGSPLYQSHHCVGQPEHVGYVQHLLVCALHKARNRTNDNTYSHSFIWLGESGNTLTDAPVCKTCHTARQLGRGCQSTDTP